MKSESAVVLLCILSLLAASCAPSTPSVPPTPTLILVSLPSATATQADISTTTPTRNATTIPVRTTKALPTATVIITINIYELGVVVDPEKGSSSKQLLDQATNLYAAANNITTETVQREIQVRHDKDGKPFAAVMVKGTNVPLLITHEDTNEWQTVNFQNVGGEKRGIKIGTSVDGAENWESTNYQRATGYFSILKAGGFSPTSLINYPSMPNKWLAIAQNDRAELYTGAAVISHYDVDPPWNGKQPTDSELERFWDSRLSTELKYIKQAGSGMFDILSEASWYSGGNSGWEKSPYFNRFKRDGSDDFTAGVNLITEAYVRAVSAVDDINNATDISGPQLSVGSNIHFLVTNYGTELAGPKSAYEIRVLKAAKANIAQKLGIPLSKVHLEVGIEGHIFGDPSKNDVGGTYSGQLLAPSQTDEQAAVNMAANLTEFGAVGPVHIVELEANYTQDSAMIHRILNTVIRAAELSGKVKSITFYETLRSSDMWHAVNSGIFDVSSGSYSPTSYYYELLALLMPTN